MNYSSNESELQVFVHTASAGQPVQAQPRPEVGTQPFGSLTQSLSVVVQDALGFTTTFKLMSAVPLKVVLYLPP